MVFLGGLLIFFSIILLLAATALCVMAAVMAGIEEVYWIAGFVWGCSMLLVLTVLGAGIALCQVAKVKKQVRQLQQLLMASGTPLAPPAFVPAEYPDEAPAAPGRFLQDNRFPPRRKSRTWIPVTIILCILALAGGVTAFLMLRPAAQEPVLAVTEPPVAATEAPVWIPAEPVQPAAPETQAPPATPVLAEEISLGETIRTEFVEITFGDMIVDTDVKYSVKTGIVTRNSGPDPVPGQKFICLSGIIRNISTASLPVYDFFLGDFDLGGYHYAVDANDCDVLDGEGSPLTKIDPLMEYTFRLYLTIPASMEVDPDNFAFDFGFYDLFENQELAYSRSFSEDPVSECPYLYTLVLE